MNVGIKSQVAGSSGAKTGLTNFRVGGKEKTVVVASLVTTLEVK